MKNKKELVLANLGLSLIGVLLVAIIIGKSDPNMISDRFLSIWGIFCTICVLGAIATIFPHKCSNSEIPSDLEPIRYSTFRSFRLVHGHHPICRTFNDHEIKIGQKMFCAGCLGLLIGSIIAIINATLHFQSSATIPQCAGHFGLGFVFLGLVYNPLLKIKIPFLRLIINVLFVYGFSIILVVVDQTNSYVLVLFVIMISVYWMYTRIQMSSWTHDFECNNCEDYCEKKGGDHLFL